MALDIRVLTGADTADVLEDLARLRVSVFRAFPYLYDGDPENEAHYLRSYGDHPKSIVVGAWDGTALVGAATGMPLAAHNDAAQLTLPEGTPDPLSIYYCAESVLLPQYRGRGIGHAFFEHRESMARQQGFDWSCFAGVVRPADHPLRPSDYAPLDPFWRKRGYEPVPGGLARFTWTDIGEAAPSEKTLQVWMRPL